MTYETMAIMGVGKLANGLKVEKYKDVTCAGTTVELFNSRLDVYVYVVDGLLIDTGPSKFSGEFGTFFESMPIEQVVLTHHHEDHSGNAARVQERGTPVYVHECFLPICQKPANLPMYRLFFWGRRRAFSPTPLPGFIETKNKTLQVIETPGHSNDHISLYDAGEGAIYTGDLFVTPKTKLCLRWENACEVMDSLEKLLQLDFQTVYCAHAGIIKNGRELLKMKLDYLENLKGEVRQLHNKGWDIRSITKKCFPKTAVLKYLSFNEWSSEHLVRSLIENTAEKQYSTL